MDSKSILYIQHADSIGGSVVSLKELIIDALSAGYRCTVICPNNVIAKTYDEIGAQTYVSPVVTFNHNTSFHYRLNLLDSLRMIRALGRTLLAFIRLGRILKEVEPNIVHLNGSNLILYTIYFKVRKIPVVFHIRECVVKGHFGIRRHLIRAIANWAATFVVYIAEFEFELLATRAEKSFVVYNYVHQSAFRKNLSFIFDSDKFKLITLGGLFRFKGGKTLLESLRFAGENVELLVLGSSDPMVLGKELSRIDGDRYLNDILELLKDQKIGPKVRFIGSVNNPADYIGVSDALVFWTPFPHFPRPVFEAWLLKVPVLYFNPQYRNEKIDSGNVFKIANDTPEELGLSARKMRESYFFSDECREKAYELAKSSFTERNFEKIDNIYHLCLTP